MVVNCLVVSVEVVCEVVTVVDCVVACVGVVGLKVVAFDVSNGGKYVAPGVLGVVFVVLVVVDFVVSNVGCSLVVRIVDDSIFVVSGFEVVA